MSPAIPLRTTRWLIQENCLSNVIMVDSVTYIRKTKLDEVNINTEE